MIRVGVDVGGTFTDIVLEQTVAGAGQRIFVHKVSSTPADQSIGVVQGVVDVCKLAGVSPGDIDMVLHGTTVATNMVIERKGADVGMITTRGFRDILHMARHKRPHNFSLQFDVPWQSKPLVKRRNRLVGRPSGCMPAGRAKWRCRSRSIRSSARPNCSRSAAEGRRRLPSCSASSTTSMRRSAPRDRQAASCRTPIVCCLLGGGERHARVRAVLLHAR